MANNIKVDNDNLRYNASRLTKIRKSVSSLESQIVKLYWHTGKNEIWQLMQSDILYNDDKKIKKCIDALSGTATELEKTEKSVASGGLLLNGLDSLKDIVDTNRFNIISVITNLFKGINSSNVTSEDKIRFVLGIKADYAYMMGDYIGDKIEAYLDNITSATTLGGAIVGVYDWFQDELLADFNTLKGMGEDLGLDTELPKDIKNSLKILKYGDLLIDNIKAIGDVIIDGDTEGLEKVAWKDGKQVFKWIDGSLDKYRNFEKYTGIAGKAKSVLVDTMFEMPKKWIAGIKNYAENGEGTAGTVVYDTTLGAVSSVVADAAKPYYKAATAATYPVIDQICETVGYDLSAEYERITGKTGLEAVFTAQKELWVDTIGGGIRDAVSSGIDKGYEFIGNAWDASIGKLFK